MAVSQHSRTYLDYSGEKSSLHFNVTALTAGNFVAVNGDIVDIGLAIADLTLGAFAGFRTTSEFSSSNPTPPTDPYAQRELKWLINYRDVTTGELYSMEIPAADLTDNLLAGTDKADLTSTDWAAFVTAFEAAAKSPVGNAVEVVSAFVVGRNL